MATSAWGVPSGPSAWASQVEDEEVSGGQLGPTSAAPVLGGDDAFPSLGEVGKVSKKDKRKGKKMSLSELQGMGSTARGSAFVPSAARQQASEPEFSLPTGPREHREDEEPRRGGFGGAGFRGGFGRDREGDDEFGSGAPREDLGPSKADLSDDWGKDRKFVAGGPDTGGRTSFSGRSFEPSRADESSTWGRSRSSTRDYDDEPRAGSRSGGFEELGPSRADTEDRWGSKGFVPSERAPNRSDSGTWGSSARRSSSPPASAPNRPRLQLKPRTLPVPDLPVAKSAPSSESGASASASEPADASLSVKVTAPPTKRSNPFGVARPREEVLKEQGKDSAQVEAEYAQRASDRLETPEEQDLRLRIADLRVLVEAGKGAEQLDDSAASGTAGSSTAAVAAPQANGVHSGAAEAASDAADESVSQIAVGSPASKPAAETAGSQPTIAEALETLEADLTRLVIENNDKQRYARAGRW